MVTLNDTDINKEMDINEHSNKDRNFMMAIMNKENEYIPRGASNKQDPR